MRLLVVEDDTRLADMLARSLRERGYAVDVTGDGENAIVQAAVNEYDPARPEPAQEERPRGQPRAAAARQDGADSDAHRA